MMVLLVALLVPGLVQARPVHDSSAQLAVAGAVTHDSGFFDMVWNLLTKLWAASPIMAKDVVNTTPSTATTPPPPSGDNGGHLDPLG
jgi:hypothetical protein